MIHTDKRMRLCVTLLICNLIFIWGNSALPGQISGAFSDWVQGILAHILPAQTMAVPGSGVLRKMAHFTEFAALGALLTWLFGMLRKKGIWPLILGVAAACVDESIQRFVPERGPSIKDVALDSCGVLTGMILVYLGHTIYKRIVLQLTWRKRT